MHAVLIRFKPTFDINDMQAQLGAVATDLCGTDGLTMKTWITQGPIVGGFHVFTDREAADAFMAGPQIQSVMEDERFTEVDVLHYAVLEAPSLINGTPSVPLGKAKAA